MQPDILDLSVIFVCNKTQHSQTAFSRAKNLNKLPVLALVQDGLNPSIYVLFSAQLQFFIKLWVSIEFYTALISLSFWCECHSITFP